MTYDIEYLGGHPEWAQPGKATISITLGRIRVESRSIFSAGNFSIQKEDIIDVTFEKTGSRSVGKAAAGAIVGGILTGGIGLLVGGALGARKNNKSELYVYYSYNGRQLMVSLKTGSNTDKIYAEINGLFA